MKFFLTCCLFLSVAHAGQIIYKSPMYVNFTLLQGTGVTAEAAEKDALSALPKGWTTDSRNSLVFSCTSGSGVIETDNEIKCDTAITGNRLLVTVPIVKK